MASKIRAKLIMELRDQGMLRRSIAKTRHMSMANVCEVFVLADEKGITWGRVMDLGDNEACAIFYPERQVHERVFEEPDWHPKADVRSIDLTEKRGLARLKVTELSTCGFVERGINVVVQDPAGTGKTYLACALAKARCAKRVRACYVRQPDLEELWRDSRTRQGGERKLLR